MSETVRKIRNVLITILAFLSGILLTFIVRKDTKSDAEEIVKNKARKLEIDIKSKEARKAVKNLKKSIEKSKRAELKKDFLRNYGAGE